MGAKKRLRRELAAAEARLTRELERKQDVLDEQTRILDSLAGVGFVWTGGERRQTDRVRAAKAGVVVLDDLYLAKEPQYRVEREFVPTMFQGDIPGPLHSYLSLELTGDPAVLEALAEHLRTHRR